MLTHIVLMKPRPDLSNADRRAFVAAFERALRDIPTIRNVRIGRRLTHGARYELAAPDTADFFAALDFDDLPSLQAYLEHPSHQELSVHFGASLSAGAAYDFEICGAEELDLLAHSPQL